MRMFDREAIAGVKSINVNTNKEHSTRLHAQNNALRPPLH